MTKKSLMAKTGDHESVNGVRIPCYVLGRIANLISHDNLFTIKSIKLKVHNTLTDFTNKNKS